MVSLELCPCFYFLRICLYAGYEHFLFSISTTPVVCLVVIGCIVDGASWCFDECENKELEDKRRSCRTEAAPVELEEWLCR